MPPKAKVSERAQKELAAQRARAQALQHLQATGSGPSQRELEADRQRRQQLANPMSAAANRRVAMPLQQQTAGGLDPRIRDNTLQALARNRASEIHAQQATSARYGSGAGWQRGDAALPDGWQEATDPASGDKYYWNEVSWLGASCIVGEECERVRGPIADCCGGDGGDWHVQHTKETSWEHPGRAKVRIAVVERE